MSEHFKKVLEENAVKLVMLVVFIIGQYWVIKTTIANNTSKIDANSDKISEINGKLREIELSISASTAQMIAIQSRNTQDIQDILNLLREQDKNIKDFYEEYGSALNKIRDNQ